MDNRFTVAKHKTILRLDLDIFACSIIDSLSFWCDCFQSLCNEGL